MRTRFPASDPVNVTQPPPSIQDKNDKNDEKSLIDEGTTPTYKPPARKGRRFSMFNEMLRRRVGRKQFGGGLGYDEVV